MSRQRSPSTSPAKNTPANYESAAREIESEKQMVAALKRLSIGHMMNLDPDIPMQDASYSFLLDREIYSDHDASAYSGGPADLVPESDALSTSSVDLNGLHEENFRQAHSSPEDSKETSRSGSAESQPSSLTEDQRHDELLWVPANLHPEVNPQQFKNHVKTTMDELLERQLSLSRSKSANLSKRSSLSLSTTDGHVAEELQRKSKETAETGSHDIPSRSQSHSPYDELKARNRLSNPSLRKLTSELQRMSELAGMDSNDAVALARSLSTSSIGYSDVERTAMDEIESAHNAYNGNATANLVDSGFEERPSNIPSPISPNSDTGGGFYHVSYAGPSPHQNYPGHPNRAASPRVSPVPESHQTFSGYNNGSFGNSPYARSQSPKPGHSPILTSHSNSSHQFVTRSNEDFSLRRSRRVDYRKSPTASSFGSQLQNNKAGKLASLRHKLSSSNLPEAANPVSPNMFPNGRDTREYLAVNQHSGSSRTSVQSINPRSSQELFSYKAPSQNAPTGRSRTAKSGANQKNLMPLGGLSTRDSPYSTAKTSDALGRSLQPTKYSHHNLTSKTLVGQSAPLSASSGSQSYEGRSRNGIRSTSYEHERQHKQSVPAYPNQTQNHGPSSTHSHGKYELRDSTSSWKSGEHRSGHRNVSSSSPVLSGSRVSSREGHAYVQGPWPDEQGQRRNVSPVMRNISHNYSKGMAPQYQHQPHAQQDQNNAISYQKSRSLSKRDKTNQLNQNLDLLRNEINEFKESLATKIDSPTPKAQPSTSDEKKAQDGQPDFSFDLTHQDVSYEDTLGIEDDVLTELSISRTPGSDLDASKDSLNTRETKIDDMVSIPETGDFASSKFRDAVAKDVKATHIMPRKDSVAVSKPEDELNEPLIENHQIQINTGHTKYDGVVDTDTRKSPAHVTDKAAHLKEERQAKEERHMEDRIQKKDRTRRPNNYEHHKESKPQEVQSAHKIQESRSETHEVRRRDTSESFERNDRQEIGASKEQVVENSSPVEKRKAKKPWPWSKEKYQKTRPEDNKSQKEMWSPVRSVSSPEITSEKRDVPTGKDEAASKENAISKFFKKRRSDSVSHERPNTDTIQRKQSSDSSDNELERQSSHSKVRSKRSSKSSELSGSEDNASRKSSSIELKRELSNDDAKSTEEHRVTSRIKNKIKSMTKIHEEKEEKPVESVEPSNGPEQTEAGDEHRPMSTIEIQEKLKKSIRRYSKPNQPIEFTDSAFGFPLPPPSSSTLIMIDYRFPVHVERAIYRLSHLKLANPKRSLREQVTLSNFMYAYLNLVDHTLHLEQQMSSDDYEVEQPEGDLDFLGDQDVDTEFEADDGFEESDFDEIKLDLDAKENEISV